MPLNITQTDDGTTGWGNTQRANLDNIKTFVDALETDLDGFPDELKFLTTAEIQQLENIDATTITTDQWGWLGALAGAPGMTDRGDPAADDFTVGDFTADDAWHDLDLSTIVPAGAKTVMFSLELQDNLIGSLFQLRKNGNANAINIAASSTQFANKQRFSTEIVSCDTARLVEYWATSASWTAITLTVRGWWF